jgi:hypothetical protein
MDDTKTNEPTQAKTKEEYNKLSAEQKKKQTYTEWLAENYNYQYERWMPWIEDQYLKWFGKGDNKASYATKGNLMILIHFSSLDVPFFAEQWNKQIL